MKLTKVEPLSTDGEFGRYLDTGCEVAPRCLSCPLPECKYDNPVHYQRLKRYQAQLKMVLEIQRDGLTTKQAARRFGITMRTVFKIKERVRASGR